MSRINIRGLPPLDVIQALEDQAGEHLWQTPAQHGYRESYVCVGPAGEFVQIFLHEDGFDADLFDRAFGIGSAQRAIDGLRARLEVRKA